MSHPCPGCLFKGDLGPCVLWDADTGQEEGHRGTASLSTLGKMKRADVLTDNHATVTTRTFYCDLLVGKPYPKQVAGTRGGSHKGYL